MEREPDPYCTSDRFAAKNGMKVIELGDGFARCQMTMDESTLNGLGIPMGGAYFTLADFCFGAANDYISPTPSSRLIRTSNTSHPLRSATLLRQRAPPSLRHVRSSATKSRYVTKTTSFFASSVALAIARKPGSKYHFASPKERERSPVPMKDTGALLIESCTTSVV